jgi:osomolarity two-component system phosphorelay intermediate protein YPD1
VRPGLVDEPDEAKCLSRIEDTFITVRGDYAEAEKVLKKFFAS